MSRTYVPQGCNIDFRCHICMCHRAVAYISDVTYVCAIGLWHDLTSDVTYVCAIGLKGRVEAQD